ncbi:hypothetical protein JCM10049v2_001592 [Rhodotorula toruloides]
MIPQLPYDVLEEIVVEVASHNAFSLTQYENADLARLALINRDFLEASRRLLYKTILLGCMRQQHESLTFELGGVTATAQLVATNTHLGHYVRCLLYRPCDYVHSAWEESQSSTLWQALLQACDCINSLVIWGLFNFNLLFGQPNLQQLNLTYIDGVLSDGILDLLAEQRHCPAVYLRLEAPYRWSMPSLPRPKPSQPLRKVTFRDNAASLERGCDLTAAEFQAVTETSSGSLQSLRMTFDPSVAWDFSSFQQLEYVHLNVHSGENCFFAQWNGREAVQLSLRSMPPTLTTLSRTWDGTVYEPHVLEDIEFVRNLPISLLRLDFFGFVAPRHLQGFLTDPKHPNLTILAFGLPENCQEVEVELAEWCVAGGYRFERI